MNKDEQKKSGSGAAKKNDQPKVKSERMNMSFWVVNETSTKFDLEDCSLQWGKWMSTPVTIPAHSSKILAFRSCGAIGSATGTEGWVRYFSSENEAKFSVSWDVPYVGKGYLNVGREDKADALYSFAVSHYDRGANDPNPVLTITNK